MKKMAILTLPTEYIADTHPVRLAKLLPEGAVMIEARQRFDYVDLMEIKVEGVGWPVTQQGAIMRSLVADVQVDDNGHVVSIDWMLPDE